MLTDQPLRVQALWQQVQSPHCGAVVVFMGTVRTPQDGPQVVALHYEAYPELVASTWATIRDELATRWPPARVVLGHRVGRVALGEPTMVLATSAPHRAAAYQANRYALEQIKTRLPLWKKEIYLNGSLWTSNACGVSPVAAV